MRNVLFKFCFFFYLLFCVGETAPVYAHSPARLLIQKLYSESVIYSRQLF